MFDIALRPLKDQVFDPLIPAIPGFISPTQVTIAAFLAGSASCVAATLGSPLLAVTLWLANRILDCVDGALARQRQEASDLGGFLDLLSDFVVYSAIPICCALGLPSPADVHSLRRRWLAVAVVEAMFHVNNFVLFYVAAVTEKHKAEQAGKGTKSRQASIRELTSLSMRPALVEGAESGVVFTLMLAMPGLTEMLCWTLAAGVAVGILQRVSWTVKALPKSQ